MRKGEGLVLATEPEAPSFAVFSLLIFSWFPAFLRINVCYFGLCGLVEPLSGVVLPEVLDPELLSGVGLPETLDPELLLPLTPPGVSAAPVAGLLPVKPKNEKTLCRQVG